MAIREPALQELADLVQTHRLTRDADAQPSMSVANRIMRLLCDARANEPFWRDVLQWCAETDEDVDLKAFRDALPRTAETPRVSPVEYFASLGLAQAEAKIIAHSIREQARRQVAIRQAFEQDNPAATAEALEKIVDDNDPRVAERRRRSALDLSTRCLVIAALLAPHLLGVQGSTMDLDETVAVYKGVTP
jgi:hypothetical protein